MQSKTTKPTAPAKDMVNHPPHYAETDNGVECIDAIRAALGREQFIGFLRGQVIRYQWRLGKKECIDAIRAALGREQFIGFLRGQVIRYQWRLGKKGSSVEDNRKAIWYANKLDKVLNELEA